MVVTTQETGHSIMVTILALLAALIAKVYMLVGLKNGLLILLRFQIFTAGVSSLEFSYQISNFTY